MCQHVLICMACNCIKYANYGGWFGGATLAGARKLSVPCNLWHKGLRLRKIVLMINLITLVAATTLTEWSERTFWRRFTDGSLKKETRNGKTVISFNSIASQLCIPLGSDDLPLLEKADAGDRAAQTELALIFLAHGKPKSALVWLGLAVKQDDPNAMYLLGRCHTDGEGEARDDNVGLMWLCKAASHGNPFASAVMQAIRQRLCQVQ